MADTIFTADIEETLLQGFIPLDTNRLELLQSGKKISQILFKGNGYFNDGIIELIKKNLHSPDSLSELTEIDLLGCNLVTDYGIRNLIQCLHSAKKLTKINLDGCEQLTDNSVALMLEATKTLPGLRCNLKGSSVAFLDNVSFKIDTNGCPSIGSSSKTNDQLHGQVLIIPHPELKTCLGEYLHSGTVVDRVHGYHRADWKLHDWTMAITEVVPSSCLLDSMTSTGLSQVLIPFDVGSEPNNIQNHVMSTISRIVAKEPVWIHYPECMERIEHASKMPFLDIHNMFGLDLFQDASGRFSLRNKGTSEKTLGFFVSRQPFTRSHQSIEVHCKKTTGRTGLLLGCLFDGLFSDRNPLHSSADVGNFVDGFECDKEEKHVEFVIEGEWLSEYVPGPEAKFFYIENGIKKKGKLTGGVELHPKSGMYPFVTVVGEDINEVSIPPIVQPPQEVINKWKAEDRWIEKGFTSNCFVDNKGRISYCANYTSMGQDSVFLAQNEITQGRSFSVTLEKPPTSTGNSYKFFLGLVPENFVSLEIAKGDCIYLEVGTDQDTGNVTAQINRNMLVVHQQSSDSIRLEHINFGDEFSIVCHTFVESKSPTLNLEFQHNGTEVWTGECTFECEDRIKIVPFIGMNSGQMLTLKNYRPRYHRPAPYKNKITYGRAHHLEVMDNGECHQNKEYGHFMAKEPFNKELLEFKVEVLELGEHKLLGVGVTEPDFSIAGTFLGWKQGQIALHADNCSIYDNSGHSSSVTLQVTDKSEAVINTGDMITVKVTPLNEQMELTFDENGNLDSHQTVLLEFWKNKILLYKVEHTILGASIYPAFSASNNSVKIHNFYPETQQVWDEVNSKKAEVQTKEEKELFSGTTFFIVGVGNGTTETNGKMQNLQQQLTFSDWPEFNKASLSIAQMEKALSTLDLQEQQTYGQLCAMKENMQLFKENLHNRLKFFSLNLTATGSEISIKERETLLTEIKVVEVNLKDFHLQRYKLSEEHQRMEESILKWIHESKLVKFSDLDISEDGRSVMVILKELQSKGKLILFNLGSELLITDTQFMISLEEKLLQLMPTELIKSHMTITAIGQSSHVWVYDSLKTNVLKDVKMNDDLFLKLLEKFFGLIRFSCLRTNPEEEQFVFAIQQNIANPPAAMATYWSINKDHTDCVVMRRKYIFPTANPRFLLPIIIANTSTYGHTVILTGEGVVYQNGAVQTVIVRHQDKDQDFIMIESNSYMPDLSLVDDTKMSKLTVSYVQDYIWNVFCIYTDVVDDLFRRSNVVAMVIKDVPKDLMNVSIGCKHNWFLQPGYKACQSVCTLCNMCCDKGVKCSWNGIMGKELRLCGCETKSVGCNECGICITCATELWDIRSRLRPWSNMMTEIPETIEQSTTPKAGDKEQGQENRAKDKQRLRNPIKQPTIPLDSIIYNEVEFTNLSSNEKLICLKEESDGTLLKVFPGRALLVSDLNNIQMTYPTNRHKLQIGDNIKIRIQDPLGTHLLSHAEMNHIFTDTIPIDPQYFASHGREVKVVHESGIVLYDTTSPAIPVGQFISCVPMTKENNTFSIRILSKGEKACIAIGVGPQSYAPNRQPGWNTQCIGYHADDGGIFLESGFPKKRSEPCDVGDVMAFSIDFDTNKGYFCKNGQKVIELNLNLSVLPLYPIIGMHSIGEAVQIIEKELWTLRNEQDRNNLPPALTTYTYGNLWISPGDYMTFTNLDEFCGWIVLHNPIKDPVGFKVAAGSTEKFGKLEYKQNWLHCFKLQRNAVPDFVTVEWTSLESGRTYSEDDMKLLFVTATQKFQNISHQHRLIVKKVEFGNSLEELPRVANEEPANKSMLCLQVFKNLRLVDEYWMKFGNYQVSVESTTKTSKFLLRYPKSPSFRYSNTFQKGMKLVVCLEKGKLYAESVVVDVYANGKSLALEYSPKDKSFNMTMCAMINSQAFKFTDFNEDEATILPYEPRNTPQNLTKTFVNAPPYLLSAAARKIQDLLDPEWKANVLKMVSRCTHVFTRLTVQEKQIMMSSRNLENWMKTGNSSYLYAFLPRELTESSLAYPFLEQMFKDISIHRLCFSKVELAHQSSHTPVDLIEEIGVRIPVHFVDIPGITVTKQLGVDILYADGLNVWTYVALIASRLYLPSYKNIMSGASGRFSREQIEQLLYRMLQIYTALCGIYSAPWGGVQYSQINEEKTIKAAIKNADIHVIHGANKALRDTDKLIKKPGFVTCKAHHMNLGVTDSTFPDVLDFDYSYFEPYTDLVTSFYWSHSNLTGLPVDFFERFKNLTLFKLGSSETKLTRFKSLPDGIDKVSSLMVIELENTAMTALPDRFFLNPSVFVISCLNMPIAKLPSVWPLNSQIRNFCLSGLMLQEIPPEISQLEELTLLQLNCNPITDLPDSMANMKKLTQLELNGIPWPVLEGKRVNTTREQYDVWHFQNPSIGYNIGQEKVKQLFTEFDINHNSSLDEEELANFNLKLFLNIPRIGIKDINDEVTGGIPSVVFKLKSLQYLSLDFNAITMVPQAINNLQNLKSLSLSHNPLLLSLPGSLGHSPNITSISVQSCPMLHTPPNEIVSRGFDSVKAYLKKLAGGFTECRRTKLMVVGLGGAGKTSLLRALMNVKKLTSGTEKETPTDGIDIIPWTVTSQDGQEVTYSTWDFAGQAVYYNTHQFFLSKRAVYLLLWSMRQGYEHAGLDFWLSSICCHAPGTPILVVGTQCDLIPQAEIPEKELRTRYPQIASFHQVSSVQGIGIADLQQQLLEITLQEGYMGEKIPQVWLNFEKRILAERPMNVNYIKWDVACQYAMEQGIYDEKDVRLAVQLLHDLGTIQYFDNDFLRDYVVINPQWIVDVMACVVSAQDSPIQKNHGRFMHSDIPAVWKEYDVALHEWLLRLTEDFDLTFPLPKAPVNIVPCLLPTEEPEDLVWPSVRGKEGIRETKMVYRFSYLPSGLFNRAQVRLFQFSNGKQIWKKGSLLSKNKHLALIKQNDTNELVVYVQGPRPENILFLIHEVFESIIEESFNGVSSELFLPCPDCVLKEGTAEPDMLPANLIERAKAMKAPFIQCYKYFHWISMAQLLEKMPTDSSEVSDFDVHLQQSIVALEELNNDLSMEIAILCCKADLQNKGDMESLPPTLIKDDIQQWGHTCWFADDMDVNSMDLMAAVKNCKILVALISDDFEKDSKCRDMFIYAKETMNKEIIIVMLGESTLWQETDLGMKIGKQERLVVAKNLHRYTCAGGRREELKAWLNDKLLQMKSDHMLPDVFISYCWTNSQMACEKGGHAISDAVGWGDPRKIKNYLQEKDISCWIDIENIGKEKKGIFADMAAGIRHSKVIVAFISDEYADSDNCMMELRFGILNMELPLIAVVVGTGTQWKETEVAMLLRRAKAPEVYMQKENPAGLQVLVTYIKDAIQKAISSPKKAAVKEPAKQDKKLQDTEDTKKGKQSSIAYQEEYELIQRKFMRHIIGSIASVDTMSLPRLIVVDFVKSASNTRTVEDGRESSISQMKMSSATKSPKILRPKADTRSRDRLQVDDLAFEEEDVEDWSKENFCMRVLCEHEGGWHLCPEMFPLAFRTRDQLETFLKISAPYLYRIFSILRQSPIKVKCFHSSKGELYQKWIRAESEENTDFVGAMMHLRSELLRDEASIVTKSLARCRLPSGKIVWLCEIHQSDQHVTKLSTSSSGGSYNIKKVLFNEDKLLMECMEESKLYRKMKKIKSTKVPAKLPEPVPIPTFVPPVLPVPPPPADKKDDVLKKENVKKEISSLPEKSSNQNADDTKSSNGLQPRQGSASQKHTKQRTSIERPTSKSSNWEVDNDRRSSTPSKQTPLKSDTKKVDSASNYKADSQRHNNSKACCIT